jgi:signal transduction histidine kinase
LSATLDQQEAIKALVDLLVPGNGTLCVVYLSDGNDLTPAFSRHTDTKLNGMLEESLQANPSKDGSPVSRVWRTGTAELHRARSLVVVPVPVRGEVIGVLSLATSDPADAYDEHDLPPLEELGRRAGIAIDNARAYQAEHAAREEAETANRAKLEFLTRMSHELRTPLNAIAGYAQLLDFGVGGKLTSDQLQYIRRIQRNQQHLLGLINDVLNFAKLGTGQLRYAIRSINVAELLQDIEALIGPQVREKSLRFEYRSALDLQVEADPDRLHQILLNLLSNAVKFTDAGGSVTIEAAPNGDQIEISVTDTGEGIPADKLQAIFDPFVQVNMSLTRVKEGTGLGLSISRDLARGMGGDITVSSAPGRGSTFTIVLPRSA